MNENKKPKFFLHIVSLVPHRDELIISEQGVILEETPYNAIVQYISFRDDYYGEMDLVGIDYLKDCIFFDNKEDAKMVYDLYEDPENEDGAYFPKTKDGLLECRRIVLENKKEAYRILSSEYGWVDWDKNKRC